MNIVGIGTDITEIARIRDMAQKHHESFLQRVYTPDELTYCGTGKASGERLAARWAAKEAVLKTLGTGWAEGIAWTDVEVRRDPAGAPSIRLTGGALRRAHELGITRVLISLSHGRDHAIAYAIAVSD